MAHSLKLFSSGLDGIRGLLLREGQGRLRITQDLEQLFLTQYFLFLGRLVFLVIQNPIVGVDEWRYEFCKLLRASFERRSPVRRLFGNALINGTHGAHRPHAAGKGALSRRAIMATDYMV